MYAKDTTWLTKMPSFTNYDTSNYANMIRFIEDIRAGISPAPSFMQNLVVSGTDTLWTAPQWPIVQNFAYTDNLTGTDGLPLGDLNWFPAKLADWNTNSAQYIQTIQDLAGKVFVFIPGPKIEAESGTVSGTAVKTAVSGLTWYDYAGSGSITWTFNAPTAGLYDTKWYVNETGRGQSGPNLRSAFRPIMGYAEQFLDLGTYYTGFRLNSRNASFYTCCRIKYNRSYRWWLG
jgi:hypothetical protein